MTKKLYRSTEDSMISGVCGGIAEYASMDPSLIRLISAVVIFFSGVFPGILAYVVASVVIPQKSMANKQAKA